MSQQSLYVPAAPGWYACPGDPPDVTRHWDGTQWLCEIRGPIRDQFDHLRARSLQGLSAEDQDELRRLTREVSRIEDLVLGAPKANPPLVEVAAPAPYSPPPVDPYTSIPLPAHPVGERSGGKGLSASRVSGGRKAAVAVGAVILVALAVAVMVVLSRLGPAR